MNKPCINCKKEIHYYAGFCHHCKSIQSPNEPKYPELYKGKGSVNCEFWGGDWEDCIVYDVVKFNFTNGDRHSPEVKLEKIPNGIEIWRGYNRDRLKLKAIIDKSVTYNRIIEEWVDEKGYRIKQEWKGKWKFLEKFEIEKFHYEGWDPKCALEHCDEILPYYNEEWSFDPYGMRKLWEKNISKGESYERFIYNIDPLIKAFLPEGFAEFDDLNKTGQLKNYYHYNRINNTLIEAKYFDDEGVLIGKLEKEGDYVIFWDGHPITIYLMKNGDVETLTSYSGSVFENIIDREKKKTNSQKEQEDLNQSRIEWESLSDNFNPQEYTKACSICFEEIKLPAKICIHCKREFSNNDIKESIEKKFREIHPYPE